MPHGSPAVNVVAVVFERIFCGRSKLSDELSNGYAYKEKPLPGSDPIDASRRRCTLTLTLLPCSVKESSVALVAELYELVMRTPLELLY